MDIEEVKQSAWIQSKIMHRPEFAMEVLSWVLSALEKSRQETDKRNSNIDLIVRNLKPEHLEEMKKLITPEIFTSLGIPN